MNASAASSENKPLLERALSVFADVRPGEAATALLLALNVFLLLGAYYIIKPVREALILTGGGAEIKSYSGAVQAALFMFIVPAYSAFASRVNRIRLINVIFIIFISNLIIFYLLSKTGIPLGIPFFLWIGLFNVMLTAQFWSFANDVYTPEQGKRLFAIVGFGSTIGAVSGSKAAEFLVKSVGVYSMMVVSAGVLCISMVLYNLIHQREKASKTTEIDPKVAEAPLGGKGGFQLVMAHRYLLLIGILTLMVNWVNTTGEYILGKSVSQMAKDVIASGTAGGLSEGQIIGGFYANFQFWQNVLGAVIQLFLVSRILKYIGIRWAIFILPLISLSSYSLLALAPILAYIRIAKIAENSTDYSLQNTVRHSLFLPTSRDAKYKAKQAVDTFFWRFGDMMSAVTVFVGAQLMHLAVRNFAIFNASLVILWIVIAAAIGRRYQTLASEQPAKAA